MAESDWDTVTVLRKKGPTAAQAKSKQVRTQRGPRDSGTAGRGGRRGGEWGQRWGAGGGDPAGARDGWEAGDRARCVSKGRGVFAPMIKVCGRGPVSLGEDRAWSGGGVGRGWQGGPGAEMGDEARVSGSSQEGMGQAEAARTPCPRISFPPLRAAWCLARQMLPEAHC